MLMERLCHLKYAETNQMELYTCNRDTVNMFLYDLRGRSNNGGSWVNLHRPMTHVTHPKKWPIWPIDPWPIDPLPALARTCCCEVVESSWYIERHVTKVCTKFERNRAVSSWIIDNFANFCKHYVTLWPWPSTSWPWTFTALRVWSV